MVSRQGPSTTDDDVEKLRGGGKHIELSLRYEHLSRVNNIMVGTPARSGGQSRRHRTRQRPRTLLMDVPRPRAHPPTRRLCTKFPGCHPQPPNLGVNMGA